MSSYFQPLKSSAGPSAPKMADKGKKRKRSSDLSSSPTKSPVHKKHQNEQKGVKKQQTEQGGNKKSKRSSEGSSSPSQPQPQPRKGRPMNQGWRPPGGATFSFMGKPAARSESSSSSSPDSPDSAFGPVGGFVQDKPSDEDQDSDEEMPDANDSDGDGSWHNSDGEDEEDEEDDEDDDGEVEEEEEEELPDVDIYRWAPGLGAQYNDDKQPQAEDSEDDPVEDEESDDEPVPRSPTGWTHFEEVFGENIRWLPRPTTDKSSLEGMVPGDEDPEMSGSEGGEHEEEQERIQNLCRELFAKDGLHPRDIRVYHLMGGSYNQVWEVEVEREPKYIVRLPRTVARTEKAGKAHQLISISLPISLFLQRHTKLPVPKVVHYSISYNNPLKRPYMIMEYRKGHNLFQWFLGYFGDYEEKYFIAKELGYAFKEMSKTTAPFPGHLVFPTGTKDKHIANTQIHVVPFNTAWSRDGMSARGAIPWVKGAPNRQTVVEWFKENIKAELEYQKEELAKWTGGAEAEAREEGERKIKRLEAKLESVTKWSPEWRVTRKRLSQAKESLVENIFQINLTANQLLTSIQMKIKVYRWFLTMVRGMRKLGYLPDDMPFTLMHDDLAHRNLLFDCNAPIKPKIGPERRQKGLTILDWDSCFFVPAFMALQSPHWLWCDHYDAGLWDEVSGRHVRLEPDEQHIKEVFDAAAGEKFRLYAYEPVYRIARQMFLVFFAGLNVDNHFRARYLYQRWCRMYRHMTGERLRIPRGPETERETWLFNG